MEIELNDYEASQLGRVFYYIDTTTVCIKKGTSRMIIEKMYINQEDMPVKTVEYLLESDDTTEFVDISNVYETFADAAEQLEILLDS
mgnify:CR=1 FL=1